MEESCVLEKAKAQALPQSFVINLYAYILSILGL